MIIVTECSVCGGSLSHNIRLNDEFIVVTVPVCTYCVQEVRQKKSEEIFKMWEDNTNAIFPIKSNEK